jgi:hypothetical protein
MRMNLRFDFDELSRVAICDLTSTSSVESRSTHRCGCRARCSSFRSAFSFAEILFAIIILGIGFIMVAAIFPVAIEQAKNTSDEVAGATIARGATNFIAGLAAASDDPPASPLVNHVAPLFPGTDLYAAPPATAAAQTAAGAVSPTPAPAPGQSITARGKVLSFFDFRLVATPPIQYQTNLWNATSGNLISTNNPAYGWIGMYKRDVTYTTNTLGVTTSANAPLMELFIIPVQASSSSIFTTADTTLLAAGAQTQATLLPKPVKVAIVPSVAIAGGVSLLAFDTSSDANTQANVLGAAENSYVIISSDNISKPDGTAAPGASDDRGYMNGRIFKLGTRRPDLDNDATIFPGTISSKVVYELQVGNDFSADLGPDGLAGANPTTMVDDDITAIGINCAAPFAAPSSVTVTGTADAFLIGKGYTPGTTSFEGAAMPNGAFTSFIAVN